MSSQDTPQSNESNAGESNASHSGLTVLAALIVMVGLMVVSYFYPYPSGKRPDFLSLLMLWGREALIVAIALAFLVVLAVAAIVKAVRALWRGKSDA